MHRYGKLESSLRLVQKKSKDRTDQCHLTTINSCAVDKAGCSDTRPVGMLYKGMQCFIY